MRYGVIAENPLERVGLAAGLVPTPRIDGYAAAFSRAIMGRHPTGDLRRSDGR